MPRFVGFVFFFVSLSMGGIGNACDEPAPDSSKIAIAGGSITEILYFLGEQSRIVAVDSTSTYPPGVDEQFPVIGYVRALSAEGILSVEPTLILGEDDMGPPEVIAQLEETNVSIVQIPEVKSASGILTKVLCIADVLGLGDQKLEYVNSELLPLVSELVNEPIEVSAPRVAFLLGFSDGAPLGGGSQTSADALLRMAGVLNVFADFEGWKPISVESMIDRDPDFIVIPERRLDSAGGLNELIGHPSLRMTTAAKQRRIIAMDGMAMLGFGPRTLGVALELKKRFHATGN